MAVVCAGNCHDIFGLKMTRKSVIEYFIVWDSVVAVSVDRRGFICVINGRETVYNDKQFREGYKIIEITGNNKIKAKQWIIFSNTDR